MLKSMAPNCELRPSECARPTAGSMLRHQFAVKFTAGMVRLMFCYSGHAVIIYNA